MRTLGLNRLLNRQNANTENKTKTLRKSTTLLPFLATSAGIHWVTLASDEAMRYLALTNMFVQDHPTITVLAGLATLTLATRHYLKKNISVERKPLPDNLQRQFEVVKDQLLDTAQTEMARCVERKPNETDFGRFFLHLENALIWLSDNLPIPNQDAAELEQRFDQLCDKIKAKTAHIADPRLRFRKIYRLLARTKYYRYLDGQANFALALDGKRANCEARAKLLLAVTQRVWPAEETNWQPVVARYFDHIEIYLYNNRTGSIYNPYFNQTSPTSPAPLHDARIFLAIYCNASSSQCLYTSESTLIISGTEMNAYTQGKTTCWSSFPGPIYGTWTSAKKLFQLYCPEFILNLKLPSPLKLGLPIALVSMLGIALIARGLNNDAVTDDRADLATSICSEDGAALSETNIGIPHYKVYDYNIIICDPDLRYANYFPWNNPRRANLIMRRALTTVQRARTDLFQLAHQNPIEGTDKDIINRFIAWDAQMKILDQANRAQNLWKEFRTDRSDVSEWEDYTPPFGIFWQYMGIYFKYLRSTQGLTRIVHMQTPDRLDFFRRLGHSSFYNADETIFRAAISNARVESRAPTDAESVIEERFDFMVLPEDVFDYPTNKTHAPTTYEANISLDEFIKILWAYTVSRGNFVPLAHLEKIPAEQRRQAFELFVREYESDKRALAPMFIDLFSLFNGTTEVPRSELYARIPESLQSLKEIAPNTTQLAEEVICRRFADAAIQIPGYSFARYKNDPFMRHCLRLSGTEKMPD